MDLAERLCTPGALKVLRRLRPASLGALLLLGLALVPPAQGQEAALDVCPTGCPYSSIQAAIDAAAPGATVRVGPGTYRESLKLKGGVGLSGAGPEQTIVQGNGAEPVVRAIGSAIQRGTVCEGLTIAGGGGQSGAGIFVYDHAAPTLRNLMIRNNVVNSGVLGGGLYVAAGADPLLEEVTIRDNQASLGSAISMWQSRATVRNSSLVNNQAQGPSGAAAAAVYVEESAITLENTVISGTTARLGGGLTAITGSTVAMSGGRLENNRATEQGGGAFVGGGSTISFNGTTIAGNRSLDGGGITVNGSVASCQGCVISGNYADQFSGGVNAVNASKVTMRDTVIEHNRAATEAGGVTVQSRTQATFEDCVIRNNATNTATGGGGGIKIYHPGTQVEFRRVKVIANEAADGAGVYVETEGTATITSSEIRENRAGRYGAGLVLNDRVSVTLSDSVIEGNQAANNGGGLWAISQAQVKVEGSHISANQSGGVGGGIIVSDGSTVQLKNNLIASNRSSLEGDGLYLAGSTVTLTNNSIVHNDPGGGGDGLILVGGATVHMTNNIVYGNGFGIRNGKPATLRRNNVYGNANANYSGFTPDGSDLSVDPRFVSGYYLSQASAGQGTTSPLVDAGSGNATDLGLHTRTTRTSGVPDQGVVDIGYHYPTSAPPPPIDYRFRAFVPAIPIRIR